jgi:hypothetical protein
MKKALISIVLALVLVVGCVPLTKDLTVTKVSGDGTWTACTWTVSAYPGETKSITIKVTNTAKTSSTVLITTSGEVQTLTGAGTYIVPAKGSKDITITWNVSPSAIPNTYTGKITVSVEIGCTKK